MRQPERNSKGVFRCFDPEQMRVCIGNSADNILTDTSLIQIKNSSGQVKEVFLDDIKFLTNSKGYFI